MRKSDFSWLTVQVAAYHGASFWRDFVLLLGNENSDAAISNVHAGRGVPTPGLNERFIIRVGVRLQQQRATICRFGASARAFQTKTTRAESCLRRRWTGNFSFHGWKPNFNNTIFLSQVLALPGAWKCTAFNEGFGWHGPKLSFPVVRRVQISLRSCSCWPMLPNKTRGEDVLLWFELLSFDLFEVICV